jgi:hypothetical protein
MVMISHEKKFIFFHVPKTAGWSIYEGLAHLASDGDPLSDKRNHGHCHDRPDTMREWIGDDKFNKYFKFAFVRNPWDRELSQYCFDHKRFISKQSFKNWLHKRKNMINGSIQKQIITDSNNHFAVNFLGRFEKLQEHFDLLRQLIDPPRSYPYKKILLPHNNASKHPNYKDVYDNEMINMVQDYLREDIALLDYEFDGYKNEWIYDTKTFQINRKTGQIIYE